jgi:diguanylate cyclase (GGDEF)-like protein
MHLDMLTMSAVSIAVTAILGLVLVFTWARAGGTPFVGWWGLAMLLQSAGVIIAAAASARNAADLLTVGNATMLIADGLKWQASRQFAHRPANLFITFAGPAGFLLAAHSGYVETFDGRLILVCTLMALYNFAAAGELARANGERLISRWPAVVLLLLTGAGFLSWLPLIVAMPIHHASAVFSSSWFPAVILVTLLIRIALAFIVLSMAKERQEMEQRADALTDALTGLPNRRALFEAADSLGQRRNAGDPISVLLFDLDYFKQTNDTFGHEVGDRVLKLFATTVAEHLNGSAIVARLGGEEFAAILLQTDLAAAVGAAETVRHAFAKSAAIVDGLAIGGTVSVGAASDMDIDSGLDGLFRRADAALYAAKRAGRNRVELLAADDEQAFAELKATVRTARRKGVPSVVEPIPVKLGA